MLLKSIGKAVCLLLESLGVAVGALSCDFHVQLRKAFNDILHYPKMIKILSETDRIMKQ